MLYRIPRRGSRMDPPHRALPPEALRLRILLPARYNERGSGLRAGRERRSMAQDGSVTCWIAGLKEGDHAAAQKLWEQYLQKVVRLARNRLQGTARRVSDEEDVALSAFQSFCQGAEAGKFPRLKDRNDLWQLLVLITDRKAIDQRNYNRRKKRGGGKVKGESAFPSDTSLPGLDGLPAKHPTPQFATIMADECRRLLDLLDDAELQRVATWKLEGYTNEEISRKLGRTRQTVQRKLQLIKQIWGDQGK